jgi:hypothetical protein
MRRPSAAGYLSAWTSMVGALAGTLRALGGSASLTEVAALSGHAFRFAITTAPEGAIGADGPNAFAASSALPLYEGLGWRLAAWEVAAGDAEFTARRVQALRLLRSCLDHGRPAILFGLHLPEFGVVRGYAGDDLLASTVVSSQYGERIPAAQWPAPGRPLPLRLFLPERRAKNDRRLALVQALRFAVAYARQGEVGVVVSAEPITATGLAAYRRWIELLEDEAPISSHGQAYCIQALQEARGQASAFLRADAQREATLRPQLEAAATAYGAEVAALSQLATLFPYPNGGPVNSAGMRRAGAAAVRRALAAEEQAITALEHIVL